MAKSIDNRNLEQGVLTMWTKIILLILLVLISFSFPVYAADDQEDSKGIAIELAREELLEHFGKTGEMPAPLLVKNALDRNYDPFVVFVLALEAGYTAEDIVGGALDSGMSTPAVISLARSVGIPMEELLAILNPEELEGLGYTPGNNGRGRAVGQQNGNPGGNGRGGTASPSSI